MSEKLTDPLILVSDSEVKAHTIGLQEFTQADNEPDSLVFDIRDPNQRTKTLPLKKQSETPFNVIVPLIKKNGEIYKNKKLYFYDEAGKQVEWLQYYLKKYGYTNYFFLKGGVGH